MLCYGCSFIFSLRQYLGYFTLSGIYSEVMFPTQNTHTSHVHFKSTLLNEVTDTLFPIFFAVLQLCGHINILLH